MLKIVHDFCQFCEISWVTTGKFQNAILYILCFAENLKFFRSFYKNRFIIHFAKNLRIYVIKGNLRSINNIIYRYYSW